MYEPDTQNPAWDSLCRKCGRCCFEKLEDERGRVFYTTTACRYLDLDSRCCKVFENRQLINPECIALTPALVRSLDWLPDDCGYRLALTEEASEAAVAPKRRSKRSGKKRTR